MLSPKTLCIGLSRVGSDNQQILVSTLEEIGDCDLGAPLHSIVIVGGVHPLEVEYLQYYSAKGINVEKLADKI